MLECRLCEQNAPLFPSLDDLEAHLASEHFDCLPYECESCHFAKFPTEFAVMKHCEKDHGFKFYSFRCRITPDVLAKRQKVRNALMDNSASTSAHIQVTTGTNAAEANSSTSSQPSSTPEPKGTSLEDGSGQGKLMSDQSMRSLGNQNNIQRATNKQQQRGVGTQSKPAFQYDVFAAHAAVLSMRPLHQNQQLVAQRRLNQMNNGGGQKFDEDTKVAAEPAVDSMDTKITLIRNDETAILNGEREATLDTVNNFGTNDTIPANFDDFEDDDGGMPIQLDLGATPLEALHAACDENIRRFSNRQVKVETEDDELVEEETATTLIPKPDGATSEHQRDEHCLDLGDANGIGDSPDIGGDMGQDMEDEQYGPTTDWLNIFANGKLNLKNCDEGETRENMVDDSLAEHSGADGEEMSMTGSGSRLGSESADHRYSLRPSRPSRYRPYDPVNIEQNSDKKRNVERIKCKKCEEMVNITGGCLMHHVNTRHLKLPLFHCTLCKKDFLEVSNTAIHKHMRLHHNGDTSSMQSNYHAYSAQLHAGRDECFGRKEERTYFRRMVKSQTSLSPISRPSILLNKSPAASAKAPLVPAVRSPPAESKSVVFLSQTQKLTPLQQHLLSSQPQPSANPGASWPILSGQLSKPSMTCGNSVVKQEHPQKQEYHHQPQQQHQQSMPQIQQQQPSSFVVHQPLSLGLGNSGNNLSNNNINGSNVNSVPPEQEKVVCRQCGDQVWNKVSNRLNHVNVKHLHIPLYQCRICQKQFQSFSRSACYSHVNFVHKAELDAGIAGSIDDNIINLKEEYMMQLQEVSTDYF